MIDVRNRVEKVVYDVIGTDRPLDEGCMLVDDLGADSLDIVELAMSLEEEFKIVITDDEMARATTFGKLCCTVDTIIERTA